MNEARVVPLRPAVDWIATTVRGMKVGFWTWKLRLKEGLEGREGETEG